MKPTQSAPALSHSELLAAIVDSSDDAIITKDLNGVIMSWNQGAFRIFGYTEEEAIGRSILMLIPPSLADEEVTILDSIRRGEKILHYETKRLRKNGTLVDISLTVSPVRGPGEKIIGVSKIARDITAQKEAQQAVVAAQRELKRHAQELERKVQERTLVLEQTVAELEAFSYSLSHDMRAPLRAIQGFSELLLTTYGDKVQGEGRNYLERIVNAAERMDRLIQEVLAFARLSRQEITVESVNVQQLVQAIIYERPELQPPRADIQIVSPLLPMLGHDTALAQCVANLLDNAVKFVEAGVQPKVRIYSEPEPEAVRLWVEDNGIGIDAEGQQRLFTLFQRVHTGNAYRGTGVGLAIVRKAAERMNGQVGVESTPGRGSRFWVRLRKPEPVSSGSSIGG